MSTIEVCEREGVIIAYVNETRILDERQVDSVGSELVALTKFAGFHKRLLLDFSGVELMSSSIIGKLLKLRNACRTAGIDLRLCSVSENVAEVFKIMHLTKLFPMYKSDAAALKSFG